MLPKQVTGRRLRSRKPPASAGKPRLDFSSLPVKCQIRLRERVVTPLGEFPHRELPRCPYVIASSFWHRIFRRHIRITPLFFYVGIGFVRVRHKPTCVTMPLLCLLR